MKSTYKLSKCWMFCKAEMLDITFVAFNKIYFNFVVVPDPDSGPHFFNVRQFQKIELGSQRDRKTQNFQNQGGLNGKSNGGWGG